MITKPDYYSGAELYDAACESGAEVCYHSNEFLEQILKAHQAKTVLDMTCGTGLQLFYLAQHGFSLVGSDLGLKKCLRAMDSRPLNVMDPSARHSLTPKALVS